MDCKKISYSIDRDVDCVTAVGKRVTTHFPIRELSTKVCGYVAGLLEDTPSTWMFDPHTDKSPSCDPSSCGKDCFLSLSERLSESFDGTDPTFPGHL